MHLKRTGLKWGSPGQKPEKALGEKKGGKRKVDDTADCQKKVPA